jgi:CMP/dCMP kinase
LSEVPVITVDGPSGTGKGTVCCYLAHWLNWHLLDSGALYRVLALAAGQRAIDPADEAGLVGLAENLDVEFKHQGPGQELMVIWENRDVSQSIRTETCGKNASRLAACPAVRKTLLDRQHAYLKPPGLVADGRDMGTVVFPDAGLKIFLTAAPEVRAQRRHNQLNEKGFDVNLAQLSVDISERDTRDRQRTVSPLRPAEDAVVIDTTDLTIDEVINRVLVLVRDHFPGIRVLPDGE